MTIHIYAGKRETSILPRMGENKLIPYVLQGSISVKERNIFLMWLTLGSIKKFLKKNPLFFASLYHSFHACKKASNCPMRNKPPARLAKYLVGEFGAAT